MALEFFGSKRRAPDRSFASQFVWGWGVLPEPAWICCYIFRLLVLEDFGVLVLLFARQRPVFGMPDMCIDITR